MIKSLMKNRFPGQLVIQFTDRCNARCPQCGMRVTEDFPRSQLESEHVIKLIDAAVSKGIRSLSFTGGEPFLRKDELLPLIRYAVDSGIPYVRTGTNGFMFMGSESKGFESRIGRFAEDLAGSGVRNFWISIDSAIPAIHEAMRGLPGVVRGIRKALPIFHQNGLYPSANLGINRNVSEETRSLTPATVDISSDYLTEFYKRYKKGFQGFYTTVIDMGFTIVNSCYPMSVASHEGLEAVYTASSSDRVVTFTKAEKAVLYRALLETIPEFKHQIRIFSPRASLYALINEEASPAGIDSGSYPCRGGRDFFFIDAKHGHTFPCGYRGQDNLGSFPDLDTSKLKTQENCKECHWECFRDPSEMAGPLVDMFRRPIGVIQKFLSDKTYARLWFEDIMYYRACRWFDGRKARQPV